MHLILLLLAVEQLASRYLQSYKALIYLLICMLILDDAVLSVAPYHRIYVIQQRTSGAITSIYYKEQQHY